MPIELLASTDGYRPEDLNTSRSKDQRAVDAVLNSLARVAEVVEVPRAPAGGEDMEGLAARAGEAVAIARETLDADGPGLQRRRLLDLALQTVDLAEAQRDLIGRCASRGVRALGAVAHSVGLPARGVSVERLLDRAAEEVISKCGFDRALVFRINGSEMQMQCTRFNEDPEWARAITGMIRERPVPLTPELLETEMIRRRSPALMLDPIHDPRGYQPIVSFIETSGYAAVPILADGNVVATIHADTHFSGREVDSQDREILAGYCAGLGYQIERAVLYERLEEQRSRVSDLVRSTESVMAEITNAEISIGSGAPRSEPGAAAPAAGSPSFHEPPADSRIRTLLTRRELEVLKLMAQGSTNAQIAERLVITEGTVKSHVKHILRKLRASNRAEAVSHLIRLSTGAESG